MLSKKKSIRAAQRGAVKKIIAKIEDELQKEDGASESELRALCDTLRKKKDMLAEMDREILEETSEESMEEEIDDSDGYVLAIDRALNKVQIRGEQTVSSVSNLSSRNLNPNANEFVQVRHNQSHQSYHKLPKLNLPYFDGNLLHWQTFWDTFETSIHENGSLSDVQKFTYLRNQVQGVAAQCIAGLPLTSGNYYQAIGIIRERFGQEHKIINANIQSMIDLPPPMSNAESLRNFSDRIECSIRGLESLGTHESSFGTILTPIIYNKLPSDVRKSITRDRGNDDWDLDSLRNAIQREVCVQLAGNSTSAYPEVNPEVDYTASFLVGTSDTSVTRWNTGCEQYANFVRKHNCLYCEKSHHPNACRNVANHWERIKIVKRKHACFNCFGRHRVAKCYSKSRCLKCGEKHHTSLCDRESRTKIGKSRTNNADECSSRADVCDVKEVIHSIEKDEIRKCDEKGDCENENATCLHFGGGVRACSIRQGEVTTSAIKPGDITQIHKDSKRLNRRKGVLQDVVRGRDGLVRTTMARTNSGETNRPISKLYTLEVNDIDCALRRSERTSVHIQTG